MRFVGLLGLLFFSAAGLFGQSFDVKYHADQITRNSNLTLSLKGDVRLTLNGVRVFADEAEFNYVTGELTPRGRVQIKTQKVADAVLSEAVFSAQDTGQSEQLGSVRLQADQITKAGDFAITLKGNARVSLKDATIYADEMEYNPLTGELTPSGHVRIQVQQGSNAKAQPGVLMDPPMPASPQGH